MMCRGWMIVVFSWLWWMMAEMVMLSKVPNEAKKVTHRPSMRTCQP